MQLVGKVVLHDLAKLKPNPWNPNEMDSFTFESLKHGFEAEGWLASMALLVWGKDDKGVLQNLIIDGEQRWTAATQLKLKKGPCVFLDGISEATAKALTIKLDQKRGKFNRVKLSTLVAELVKSSEPVALGLDLGIGPSAMAALLKPHAIVPPTTSRNVHTRQVPLYFDEKQAAEFHLLVQELAKLMKTGSADLTVTDVVLDCLRKTSKLLKGKAPRG